MATTFTCPHCQASYPFKPVLIGRPVRCTTCRQAFQLGADGIAVPVAANLVATNRVPTRAVDGTRTRTPLPPSSQALVRRSGKTPPPSTAAAASPVPAPAKPAPAPVVTTPAAAKPAPAPAPAKPAPAPAPAKPAPAPAPKPGPTPATATAPAPAPTTERSTRASSRLNTRGAADQAFRQKLFAGLEEVASQVAIKTAGKTPANEEFEATAKPSADAPSPGLVNVQPVLTHSGEQEYRSNRTWLIGSIVVVVVVVIAFRLIGHSPERLALEAYASPAAVQSGPFHGTFFSSLTQKCWLVGRALPLRDLGKVSIQSARTIPVGAAKDILKTLVTTKIFLTDRGVWIDQAAAATAPKLWDPKMDIAGNLAALHAHNIDGVDQHDVVMKCRETGLSPDDVDLLMELLLGTTDAKGGNLFMERFRQGDFPATLRVADFSGHGTALIYTDSGYQAVVIDYDGRLMRVEGKNWPADWQVLDLHQRDRDRADAPDRGAAP